MGLTLKLLGHGFFLAAIIAAGTDLLSSSGSLQSLERFIVSNDLFDIRTMNEILRSYMHAAVVDYLYKPLLLMPASLFFFICALIFWSVGALLQD